MRALTGSILSMVGALVALQNGTESNAYGWFLILVGVGICWFQFRIETWFLLVAIMAWAMTMRPWLTAEYRNFDDRKQIIVGFRPPAPLPHPYIAYELNPALHYPALALAAFVGSKTGWLIVQRQRKRAEASPV